MPIIGHDGLGVTRVALRQAGHSMCKGAAFILLIIPGEKVDLCQEALHSRGIPVKIFKKNAPRVPVQQDAAKIKDDGRFLTD